MQSLATELVEWAKARPGWQRQLLSRIAQGETLTAADYRKIAAELARGDDDSEASFTLDDTFGIRHDGSAVCLLEMTTGRGVNALVPGQSLSFASEGLTVVYGDNGSGKSGYARLLKHVAGARVQEPVLSDIFSDDASTQPQAQLILSMGGAQQDPCSWLEAPAEAKRIAFFDESCGDAYVTRESDVTYRPAELFLLNGLITACDAIRTELDDLLRENDGGDETLPAVSQNGTAAQFLASLSESTTKSSVDAACRSEAGIEEEIKDLESRELELRNSEPSTERNRLRHLADRYEIVLNHLALLGERLGTAAVNDVAGKRRRASELRAAATIAAQQSFATEPLTGVGSETWRALWEAARSFSEAEAYLGEAFPRVGPGAMCVLCHQDLNDDAQSRLERFEASVTDQTQQQARVAEREAEAAVDVVRSTVVDPSEIVAALAQPGTDDAALVQRCRTRMEAFKMIAGTIVASDTNDSSAAMPRDNLEADLRAKVNALRNSASQIDATEFDRQRSDIADQLSQRRDQQLMSNARETILAEVVRLGQREQIVRAKASADTSVITRKATQLTRAHVTTAIQDRFTLEADRLRLKRVVLADKGGRKGQLRSQPRFDGARQEHPMSAVLSDGEQGALGLVGFFTEACFDQSKSALVLDDPVSSLDHVHRSNVAMRLVEFAADRQVIVFTHDLAFVAELCWMSRQAEVDFTERSVELQGDATPGVCVDSHPWKAKDVKARLGRLEQDLVRIKKNHELWPRERYELETSDWAGKLSESLERAIGVEVAGRVYDPNTLKTHTEMFRIFGRITESDNKEFQASFSRVSRWVRRHDKSPGLNYVQPKVDELVEELDRVRSWFRRIQQYWQ